MKIFVIAGEPSGDLLGQGLIRALRERVPGVEIMGVGGDAMTSENFVSLFPMHEISLMGVLPVLANLRNVLRRIDQTARAVIAARPDVLVLIDSPDFNHRVARRVRKILPNMKIVNYVGPTVWAWRPGRAKKMRAYVDLILAIFPFEPEVHVRLGGPRCVYIGHPLIERRDALRGDDEAKKKGPILVLPGSRASVVQRMGDAFGDAIARLDAAYPGLDYVLPTSRGLAARVGEMIAQWRVKPRVVVGDDEKYAAFRAARAALAASGTVTLELALSRTPTIVAYRVPKIEEFFARRLIQVSMVAQPNIILGEKAFPELLQDEANGPWLAERLAEILDDGSERRRQIEAMGRIEDRLAITDGKRPSEKAAEAICQIIRL
ncbi:lipid-A-disaccharide synthase [Rhodoblastus acidophilus]|uniref:Lipid-A-disaccharide synthase n=1 Tax=Candidatus Rhodoblastus alkanivorans TaxID=2954117 RepID=A0ABS9Z6A5_9HYPH|nr:lipid-A-disaccharide synthase [Candidatus Rhodoblastus alkanivorans]MCI4680434.1 lipid-A-disaccharide synthase [Candidatus Rhodoblastus alkanivorans]MCI4683203.1 lipid-A-disaccharide synthase [Candidatus Rhodoblastus alkanivorans]MDI4640515.1 lipid-A-disaccharide synthase [Rhodoblastus acidophilus]